MLIAVALVSFTLLHVTNIYLLVNYTIPALEKTGMVTQSATITLTNSGTAGITMNNVTIPFGSGYYNGSCPRDYAIIDSNDSTNPSINCWVNTSGFINVSTFHTIENSGQLSVNVTAYSDKQDAEQLMCINSKGCNVSETAEVALKALNREVGACSADQATDYLPLLTHDTNKTLVVCSSLNAGDANDVIDIAVKLSVPIDVKPGAKSLDITYEAISL
jgi:hypothetical protein